MQHVRRLLACTDCLRFYRTRSDAQAHAARDRLVARDGHLRRVLTCPCLRSLSELSAPERSRSDKASPGFCARTLPDSMSRTASGWQRLLAGFDSFAKVL